MRPIKAPDYIGELVTARKYVNKHVRTTDGREGVVYDAWPANDGCITLWVADKHGNTFFTDNEHATMTRGQNDG